jgi:dipeptidyl aminopeptidase/acylaminoacyl peptidase
MLENSRDWSGATWSPDGTRLAFAREGDIFIASADGDGVIRLTGGNGPELAPSWLPGGRRLMFLRGGAWWTIRTDGSDATPLGLKAEEVGVLSPDGTKMALPRWDPDPAKWGLYIVDLSTPGLPEVMVAQGGAGFPAWSPDGSRITFVRYTENGGGSDVWIVNVDGSGERLLHGEFGVSHYETSWSPSGDRIAVTRQVGWDESTDIYTMAADGTDLRRVTSSDADEHVLDWGVAPACDIYGSAGDDVIRASEDRETICAGAGDDRILAPGDGDLVIGGPGIDRLDFRNAATGITVDLRAAKAEQATVLGVETILGTAYDDVVRGDDDRNAIHTYGGNDVLFGRDGDDTLSGGLGDDLLRPGIGGDDIIGGDGLDAVSYVDAPSRVRLNLGNSLGYGQDDIDIIVHVEKAIGSAHDDMIIGGDGHNVLKGGDGEDTLQGQAGPDDLYGGDERDFLYGDAGSDTINGADGRDYGDGGEGDDRCLATEQVVAC